MVRERTSQVGIRFFPGRLPMHDTTCVAALVDIAAMRDAIAETGGVPALLSPRLPVDVSVDHCIGVDRFGATDALRFSAARELERDAERFRPTCPPHAPGRSRPQLTARALVQPPSAARI